VQGGSDEGCGVLDVLSDVRAGAGEDFLGAEPVLALLFPLSLALATLVALVTAAVVVLAGIVGRVVIAAVVWAGVVGVVALV
jgi:hypothetical protein